MFPGLHASPDAAKALAESINLANQACDEIRTFSYLLHPPMLDEAGLDHALRWYVDGFTRRTNMQVDLQSPAEVGRLPHEMETAIFRIVQECLTNIHRHSQSAKAEIRIGLDTDHITLEVRDYGRGLPPASLEATGGKPAVLGVGIQGMRERVRQLGGELKVSTADPGTKVWAVLPLPRSSR